MINIENRNKELKALIACILPSKTQLALIFALQCSYFIALAFALADVLILSLKSYSLSIAELSSAALAFSIALISYLAASILKIRLRPVLFKQVQNKILSALSQKTRALDDEALSRLATNIDELNAHLLNTCFPFFAAELVIFLSSFYLFIHHSYLGICAIVALLLFAAAAYLKTNSRSFFVAHELAKSRLKNSAEAIDTLLQFPQSTSAILSKLKSDMRAESDARSRLEKNLSLGLALVLVAITILFVLLFALGFSRLELHTALKLTVIFALPLYMSFHYLMQICFARKDAKLDFLAQNLEVKAASSYPALELAEETFDHFEKLSLSNVGLTLMSAQGPLQVFDNLRADFSKPGFYSIYFEDRLVRQEFARLISRQRLATEGSISLNDIHFEAISDEVLRSRLCLIDEPATLLSGTLASNIDLTARYDIESVQTLADILHMSTALKKLPMGLLSSVAEAEELLSPSFRTKIALGRALIQGAECLILDALADDFSAQELSDFMEILGELSHDLCIIYLTDLPELALSGKSSFALSQSCLFLLDQ